MISKPHKKHADIQKPLGGRVHRNEFGFIGAPCGIIQDVIQKISANLSTNFIIGYLDAEHQAGSKEIPSLSAHYVDKIDYHQFSFESEKPEFQYRNWFNENDLVFINGNHFDSDQQIVFLNSKKKDSLQRKMKRLNNVIAFIQDDEEVYNFLKSEIPDWKNIPVISIDDVDSLSAIVITKLQKPIIKGLVLAGGKSIRMGKDKGAIEYHGKPQREYMAGVLKNFCSQVYLSVAPNTEIESEFPVIEDSFLGLGPYGGILSAFKNDPNAAWLVVACDQPLLDEKHLKQLIEERDVHKLATCFHNPETNFPEPLITLWEPRAYPVLLQFLAQGYSCPRKVLINSNVKELKKEENDFMLNANTPEEYEGILKKLPTK